ncbi:MAG: Rrf2 family transcriptional regulator [Planctomycetes bacterium]|nr:Rrf2 family transcriptional regulator [Planctomycetota bacterium]
MRMSRASAYAIGAVLQLADTPPKVPIPCSQLAKTGEMPERFLLQVLRNLVNHGLLKSTRGVDGGYYLLRPASEITLLSIIEATDGPLTPVVPPLDGISEASRERLHALLTDIAADTCRRMAAVKLTDLRSAKSSEPDHPDNYFDAEADAEAEVDQTLSSL